MDSQENAQKQGATEEKNVEQTSVQVENALEQTAGAATATAKESKGDEQPDTKEETAASATKPAAPEETEQNGTSSDAEKAVRKVYNTKKEVLDRLKEIVSNGEIPDKAEIDQLKTTFYKLHIAERDNKLKEYIENGGEADKYQIKPDEDEEVFKAEMGVIREKRAEIFRKQEEEKKQNLEKKLEIINKIKDMATSPDEANKSYQEFKELQQQWHEIKAVPAEKANELWRNYQLYVEQFYDLLKLNSEAREYDFKKNLELKTKLCEAAEKLADEPDVISAFHQLQELHQQYREIGPVAKELREQIWSRFKAASTVINKRHQKHFEDLRAKEEDNLTRKTALCEKVESIAKEECKNAADWEKHTKEIIAVQAEWKTIGFAPQKMNVKIFERFRSTCDDFFERKAAFFKEMKQRFAENEAKKRDLIDKAKALSDSTEWKQTAEKLIALQKEWKNIGSVPKKIGDLLWNDFNGACNKFFEARKAATSGTRSEERANLEKKRAIIEQLKALTADSQDDVQAKAQKLVDEYNTIGHVPFAEKDKLFKEYHDTLDKLYKELNVTIARRRLDKFKDNLKNVAKRGEDAIDNERSRFVRRYEQLRQEVLTYENNLGFLNTSSKKGNSLIDELNRKVQKLKDDMQLVKEKIKAIDSQDSDKAE